MYNSHFICIDDFYNSSCIDDLTKLGFTNTLAFNFTLRYFIEGLIEKGYQGDGSNMDELVRFCNNNGVDVSNIPKNEIPNMPLILKAILSCFLDGSDNFILRPISEVSRSNSFGDFNISSKVISTQLPLHENSLIMVNGKLYRVKLCVERVNTTSLKFDEKVDILIICSEVSLDEKLIEGF